MNDEVKHTPIPWRVGTTLLTAQTRRWSAEHFAANEAIENRGVFAYFSTADEGRSRLKVAECDNHDDAAFIVEAVNNYDRLREVNAELLEALEAIEFDAGFAQGDIDTGDYRLAYDKATDIRYTARAAIARARGENVNA